MAAKVAEVGPRWDPYETSHRRQFVHKPNSAADVPLRPASSAFVGPCAKSRPLGSSVYGEDFSRKEACREDCVRGGGGGGGTAWGHRRNNPHPSQSFLNWRLPRGASQFCVGFPEGEAHKAAAALFRSTYTCDFTGSDSVPCRAEGHGAALCASPSAQTEMRDNYRRPELKPELKVQRCCTDPGRTRCGIVPSVVQRNALPPQHRGSDLTTYNRFYGNGLTHVGASPAQESLKTVWSKHANNVKKENGIEAVVCKKCSLERMSSWTGPH